MQHSVLYTIKSVYIEFLEVIKNCASVKSVLKEAEYNEALLYICSDSFQYTKSLIRADLIGRFFIWAHFHNFP